jgi:hypothetical protein
LKSRCQQKATATAAAATMTTQQVLVYLDNVQGYSSYRPFAVYDGNTLSGLWEFVVKKIPALSAATYTCWTTAGHRTPCPPVFSEPHAEAHFVIKAKSNDGQL